MAEYLCEKDMNTGEYISRDEALKSMQYCCENCDNYNGAMCRACDNADEMDIICDIPAADVQPVKRGRWVTVRDDGDLDIICTRCYERTIMRSDFCPHCGADMRGEDSV